jgi:hypothetical protein
MADFVAGVAEALTDARTAGAAALDHTLTPTGSIGKIQRARREMLAG